MRPLKAPPATPVAAERISRALRIRIPLATVAGIISQLPAARVLFANAIDLVIEYPAWDSGSVRVPRYMRRLAMIELPSTRRARPAPMKYRMRIGAATTACVTGSIDGVTIAATTTASSTA